MSKWIVIFGKNEDQKEFLDLIIQEYGGKFDEDYCISGVTSNENYFSILLNENVVLKSIEEIFPEFFQENLDSYFSVNLSFYDSITIYEVLIGVRNKFKYYVLDEFDQLKPMGKFLEDRFNLKAELTKTNSLN